jgi:nucleotide-binding universal stress UspA family protein
MIERILVPLDTTKEAERVLPYVTMLASRLGVPVVLLAVVPDLGEVNPVVSLYDAELAQLTEFRRGRAEQYLQALRDRLDGEGIHSTVVVEAGPVADRITSTAEAQQASVIAMATHGRVGPARMFLGSVADKVVRTTSTPVLLIRPREGDEPVQASVQRVFVPLDGSPLAETALPYATFLARQFHVPITAIRDVPTSWLLGSDPSGMSVVSPEVVQSIEDEAESYVRGVVDRLRAEGLAATVRFGPFNSPAADIISLAEETPGALIVMTTHGRSGWRRALLGSVTDRVIRSSVAPVLVVPAPHEDDED